MSVDLEVVLDRLDGVRKASTGFIARCPVPGHGQGGGDRNPSLSVTKNSDGTILFMCHAGCEITNILSALNLKIADLFPANGNGSTRGRSPRRIVAEYDYRNENGTLLYQVVRYDDKTFKYRHPDGSGGWVWSIKGVPRVLFRLPELVTTDSGKLVFIPEGEKDVLNLQAIGLAATTNPMGAGKWRAEYNEVLKGRTVVVLADNDRPGREHAQKIARSLHGSVASVKIIDLPGLPEAGDVSDWLGSGGTKETLLSITDHTPAWNPNVESATTTQDLSVIIVTNRQMRDVSEDAFNALCRANNPPRLFERDGRLVRVRHDENERPLIEELSEAGLRGELERAANFRAVRKGREEVHTPPPQNIVRDVLSRPDLRFPPLEAIIRAPVLRPDGSVLATHGYDSTTRLYYKPSSGLFVPTIPDTPDDADVIAAKDILFEVIEGFPFVDQSSRANAIGLMFTPVVRPAISSPVPMGMIDAPDKGTGKTLLAETISIVATGKAELLGAPKREEEWEKFILGALSEGSTCLTFDNLKGAVSSPTLERALTAHYFGGRLLGTNRIGQFPQRATWIGTANNVELGGDLARRCFWIRMDAKMARPWMGRQFLHPDLLGWVMSKRGEILGAILTLCRAWYAAGCPKAQTPRLGKFEAWVDILGSILSYHGIEGFLGNLDEMYAVMDDDTAQWEDFLRWWHGCFGSETRTVSDVVKELLVDLDTANKEQTVRVSLPDELADAFDAAIDKKKLGGFSRKLGKALKRKNGKRYDPDGLHLENVGMDTHAGSLRWRVTTDAGFAGFSGPNL